MDDGPIAELWHWENYRSPAIAFAKILDGIAITYQTVVLTVYHPLQSITEEAIRVIEYDGLHQLWRSCKRDALHEADIFHSFILLL